LLICSTRACSAAARTAAVALSRACCLEFMKVPQPAMVATRTMSAPPATSRTGTAGLQTHLAGGGVEPGGNYGLYGGEPHDGGSFVRNQLRHRYRTDPR